MSARRRAPVPPAPRRGVAMLWAAGAAAAFLGLLTLLLPPGSRAATLLLDRTSPIFPYPFTVQNMEWVCFFLGLGEVWARWRTARRELAFLGQGFLPEDEETVLQASDLGDIRRLTAGRFDGENGFLPAMVDMCVLQFQAGRSVDQTVSVLNSQLDIVAHRVDLRYALLRYLSWVIPTLGFIGTVVGIASTLVIMKQKDFQIADLTATLSTAFDTTILALAASGVLVFFLNMVQAAEERGVNLAGHYCLKNLVNRLYAGGG